MRSTHWALASSRVNQFTKDQLFSDLWALAELELPLNPNKSARKHVQERDDISCLTGNIDGLALTTSTFSRALESFPVSSDTFHGPPDKCP